MPQRVVESCSSHFSILATTNVAFPIYITFIATHTLTCVSCLNSPINHPYHFILISWLVIIIVNHCLTFSYHGVLDSPENRNKKK